MVFDQQPFDIRCEWGIAGLRHLAESSDAIVIVEVLSLAGALDASDCVPVLTEGAYVSYTA
jgi:2-phosphosulfolactate phosphatase